MAAETIRIIGARQHNLKNVSIEFPRERLVVFTGMSGSGKSSLAFDTLYAEGQRRYVESLSAYARQFLDQMEKPDVDFIEGLSPAIAIEQRSSVANPRSTIATTTDRSRPTPAGKCRAGYRRVCGTRIAESRRRPALCGSPAPPDARRPARGNAPAMWWWRRGWLAPGHLPRWRIDSDNTGVAWRP